MDRLAEIVNNPRASHRERILYALGKLPVIPEEIPGPKFVYAHIIFPHPPFVMDADGNPLQNSPPNELSAYADQITYLDRRLLEIVDILIENSDPDPVIVIQGDHGATIEYQDLGIDPSKRLGILNAYYLPAHQNELNATAAAPNESLYPTISPVNTFRVIFDRYFNGEYGLLEDRSIVGRQSPYTSLECALLE
jgi:arylsulfatase A-like enzyme